MKVAIILCSGGIDSVVTSYYIKKRLEYKRIIILFFNYGQKALTQERKCAKNCSELINAEFKEINLDFLKQLSTSLINIKGKIREVKMKGLANTKKEGKKWYVPGRNTLFLIYALVFADSLYISKREKSDIFVGFKSEGQENYPDTTRNFLNKVNKLSNSAFSVPFIVKAPLINMDKEEIISLGKRLGLKFDKTFSCFIGKKYHCGYCLACKLRQSGFYWANLKDPTIYKYKIKDFRLA